MKKRWQVHFWIILILLFVGRVHSATNVVVELARLSDRIDSATICRVNSSTTDSAINRTATDSPINHNATITILFSNSTNGILKSCPTCPNLLYGGLSRRATLIKEYREKSKNILLLDSGDLFPVIAPEEQVECVLKAVELMKYDAIGIGDQEFTYGKDFLLQKIKEVGFPFVSSTIAYTNGGSSQLLGDGHLSEPVPSHSSSLFAKPYVIKEIAGLKILIIGIVSEKTFLFFPKEKIEGLTILDPTRELKKILSELEDKVDFVIVLSHLGEEYDRKLAEEVDGINLIVGGHTQTLIEEPVRVGNTIIVQAGKNGEHLGEITFNITKNDTSVFNLSRVNSATTIINYKLTLLTDKIPDDPEISKLIEKYESTKFAQVKAETVSIPIQEKSTTNLSVLFFYLSGCHSCEKIKNEFFPSIRKKYAGVVEIKEYDISKKENYELLITLEEKYGATQNAPMKVFVEGHCLSGEKEIKGNLEQIIKTFISGMSSVATSRVNSATPVVVELARRASRVNTATTQKGGYSSQGESASKIIQRFKSFGPLAIIVAGLIDGINPCAFATIIFFISFLAYTGKSKKDTLLTGIFFTIGVFCAYFLLGIGLFKILHTLFVFNVISKIIFYAIFVLTLSLGCLSLYDAYIFKKTGNTEKITLQLPGSIKKNIHFWIRKNINAPFIIIGALITGFLVSLFEAVCTGQIYLPTITFMTKEPSLAAKAYFYLFLYNLMFIVPLIIVFSLAYAGMSSWKLGQFSQRHIVLTKVLTAIFFFGLATLLIVLK